ncbi:MAG: hypothetical protein IKD07_06505, partial [Clostridia bacterium]|nr:hypothetical protein [Clostridia bacterium]
MSYLGSEIKRTASNTSVRLRDIPVCRYGLSIYDEKRIYTNKDFLRIYRDMALIREFEIMLLSLQTKEFYRGIRYSLKKSVAVRLGREALSVGEAYCAEPSDDLFSAENNIADLLAKGLSAIEKMTEEELAQIMKGYHGGKVLSPLSEIADKKPAVKDVALSFLLYGTLSEFFGKATGFAYGLRGADVCFAPIGFYSCNGAKTDLAGLAVGAGLYRKNFGTGGCVIANMSADAVFDGKTLEAFCYAESGAFRTNKGAGLPVLFTMVRGRDADESDGAVRKCTSRICAGIGANGMYTEAVNGSDPLAVIDAVSRKKDILKRGDGAALLEAVCDDLRENPKGADPVKLYREKLIRYGIASDSELKKLEEYVSARLEQICRLAADDTKSPPAEHTAEEDLALPDGTPIGTHRKVMPEVKLPPKDCKRWQELQKKKKEPSSYTLGDALAEPILDMLYRDPDFIVCGMNENDGVLEGFSEVAEPNRLLRAFVSEAALVSCAVGYALRGGRAVLSLEGTHSLLSAADILSRQLSQWQSALGGRSIPLVLRVPVDSNQNTATAFAVAQAVPGLKTVYPVTPCAAKGLM